MRRRQFLRATAAGSLAAATGCLGGVVRSGDTATPTTSSGTSTDETPGQTHDGGWPMADFAAGATGHNPAASTAEPTETAWTLSFREHEWFSDPAIDAERAYFGVKDWEETPATSMVRAHALDDGSEVWAESLPHAQVFAPARGSVDGDDAVFVAFGQDNSNTDHGHGEVRAFAAESGDELWSRSVGRQISGPPVYAGSRVLVPTEGLGEGGVHALDAASGEQDWFFDTARDTNESPTVADDTVFVSSDREELAALDAETGDVQWRTATNRGTTRPVVNRGEGLVYVGFRRGLEAFAVEGGDPEWTFEVTEPSTPSEDLLGVVAEPVLADGTLYVRTSDTSGFAVGDPGNLYAVDPATGDSHWTLTGGRPDSVVVGADGHALVARASAEAAGTGPGTDTSDGELVCVTPNGEAKWTSDAKAPLAVGHGYLFCFEGARASAPGTSTLTVSSL